MQAMRERTLVGLFVLIAGGLLFGTMLAVSGGIGTSSVSHRAFFKFAGGVQPGAPVRYGGLTVGKVERVRVDPGNSTRIEIQLAVDRDAPLKTDSVAKISTLGPLTDNYIEVSTGTEHAALALLERSAVAAALQGLPMRQREAIVLRYYADFSEADIAKAMGISKGAVKSHTARAMASLKMILSQETA